MQPFNAWKASQPESSGQWLVLFHGLVKLSGKFRATRIGGI